MQNENSNMAIGVDPGSLDGDRSCAVTVEMSEDGNLTVLDVEFDVAVEKATPYVHLFGKSRIL